MFDTWLPEPAVKSEPEPVPLAARPRAEPISRNYFVIEDPEQTVVGEPQIVFAHGQNTFSDLAREYGLGYDELVAANPMIDPWLPGEGTPILLPTQYVLPNVEKKGVVLNIASKRLFYFPEAAEGAQATVMTYPIGIGRVGWETPLGETSVVAKARDPNWYVPASVRKEHADLGDPLPAIVPAGPNNPLGRHVLKLGLPGYLIHGTNQPYGVGMRVSHGCVRLYPENIELLYSLVAIGEDVQIINEPYLLGQLDGRVYFESHEPLEDDAVGPEERLAELLASNELISGDVMTQTAHVVVSLSSGVPIDISEPDTMEVFARARVIRNTVQVDPEAPTLDEVRALLDASEESQDDVESGEPLLSHD